MTNKELADKTVLLLCEEDENREYDNLVLLAERILNENDCSFKARVVALLIRHRMEQATHPSNQIDLLHYIQSEIENMEVA